MSSGSTWPGGGGAAALAGHSARSAPPLQSMDSDTFFISKSNSYLVPPAAQGLPWEIQCQALTDEKERAIICADVDLPVWLCWVVGSVHGLQDGRALSPSWKDERLQKPSGTLIAVQGSGSSR